MAIGAISPFRPTGTVSLNASSASSSVPLAGAGSSLVITNTTTSLAYVAFGVASSLSASSSDMPLLPNSKAMLCINDLASYGAAVLASGSGAILFTRGEGSFI